MRILVICDGSPRAVQAAGFLRMLRYNSATQVILLAVGQVTRSRASLQAHLTQIKAALGGIYPDIRELVSPGRLMDQVKIEANETNYDLVVVGDQPVTGTLKRLSRARMVAKLAHRLWKPLLIVRGLPDHLERVLICTSAEPAADLTLEMSAKLLASQHLKEVRLLHVMSQVALSVKSPGGDLVASAESAIDSGTREGQHFVSAMERLRKAGLKAPIKPRLRHGLVLDEVRAEVRHQESELLVIGSHHRAGRSRLIEYLLEDVAQDLLQEVPCSVLVIG